MGIDHSCASLQHKDAEKVEALGGVEGLAKALNVHMEDGISAEATGDLSVKRRQELYGANRFATVPAQSFWAILLDALSDKVLIVLMVAATVCSATTYPLLRLCPHLHPACGQSEAWLGMRPARAIARNLYARCPASCMLSVAQQEPITQGVPLPADIYSDWSGAAFRACTERLD